MIRAARVLAVACGAHFIHDASRHPVRAAAGLGDRVRLSFTQVGLLKTLYTGACLLPGAGGHLAERRGRRACSWRARDHRAGFLIAGLTGTSSPVACLWWPLGSSCQHPLSSSLVAEPTNRASPHRARHYNFSGDRQVAVPPRWRSPCLARLAGR